MEALEESTVIHVGYIIILIAEQVTGCIWEGAASRHHCHTSTRIGSRHGLLFVHDTYSDH